MFSADAADGDRSRDASEPLDWSAPPLVRLALRYIFGATHPNDVAGSTLAEALAQFQQEKLSALSFQLSVREFREARSAELGAGALGGGYELRIDRAFVDVWLIASCW